MFFDLYPMLIVLVLSIQPHEGIGNSLSFTVRLFDIAGYYLADIFATESQRSIDEK